MFNLEMLLKNTSIWISKIKCLMEATVLNLRILVLFTLIKNITQDLYGCKASHTEFYDYKYMKLAHFK